MNVGLTIDEEFLLDCFTITTEPNPELRLHFERHPNRALSILTVDRMAVLVKTPNSKEVLLTNVESRFLYHQSLWAEVRESSKGASHKAFPSKKNPSGDPVRAPLTDFEKRYWDVCKWNVSGSRLHFTNFLFMMNRFRHYSLSQFCRQHVGVYQWLAVQAPS
jgi:hypothetical protein